MKNLTLIKYFIISVYFISAIKIYGEEWGPWGKGALETDSASLKEIKVSPKHRNSDVQPKTSILELAFNFYSRFIAPYDSAECNFKPSCSQYSREAFKRFGFIKGMIMTTDRLSRCHYCAGFYYPFDGEKLLDPIEDNILWKERKIEE